MDTDAKQPCVVWPELRWIGRFLSGEYNEIAGHRSVMDDCHQHEGCSRSGPSTLCYALQLLCLTAGAFTGLTMPKEYAQAAGMDTPNELLYIYGALAGLANVVFALTITSAQTVLCPGGALDELARSIAFENLNSEVRIRATAARSNSRSRNGLLVLAACFWLFGLSRIAASALELEPYIPSGSSVQYRTVVALRGMVMCAVGPIAICGCWASMFIASSLCRDEISELMNTIDTTDPTSEGWDAKVADRTIRLRKKFGLLSDGWSPGLIGLCACILLAGTNKFANGINAPYCAGMDAAAGNGPGTERITNFAYAAICLAIPFPIAFDIAQTSSDCDSLVEHLNEKRMLCIGKNDDKITRLETAVLRLVCLCFSTRLHHTIILLLSPLTTTCACRTNSKAWASISVQPT